MWRHLSIHPLHSIIITFGYAMNVTRKYFLNVTTFITQKYHSFETFDKKHQHVYNTRMRTFIPYKIFLCKSIICLVLNLETLQYLPITQHITFGYAMNVTGKYPFNVNNFNTLNVTSNIYFIENEVKLNFRHKKEVYKSLPKETLQLNLYRPANSSQL